MFGVDVRSISNHIKNIFSEGELLTDSVVQESWITAADGKTYRTNLYSLDVIIAVEDDRALAQAVSAQAALRNAAISADMIATGSPRKRYDKAAKTNAKILISFQHDGESAKANIRSAPGSELHARVAALLNGISTV